jgi:2-succinyl-5-enolpyruvyl-6-hydroxy-3-cyclohexene-1-carboxylate synthase
MPVGSATLCARVIIEELIARGVRDVVLAPGSRSAPLAYEVFDADRIGLLRLHVRIDERSAAFVAVGLAKASESPVAVVTTSGTAAANLYPAVLESDHSHLPVIMITADRPRAMSNTGANQTTDQVRLFGTHVRTEAQLEDTVGEPRAWRFQLARLLIAATGARTGSPGPVHLNVGFSDPLIPDDASAPSQPELTVTQMSRPTARTPISAGPQTVIVAGDLPPAAGRALAQQAAQAAVPLLAEPSSNARRGPAALSTYRLMLGSELAADIERVILVGHPTLSRPVNQLLARSDVELIVVAAHPEWIDPGLSATLVANGIEIEPSSADWLAAWQQADDALQRRLDQLLRDQDGFSGPALAAVLWSGLNEHDTLLVGSSNPVRDADLAPISPSPPVVYANRGLAGIDGTVSTAVGVGLAIERPTHALLGDLTFLHDSNGLIIGPDEPRPDLRFVVANDDGGSIFATLEHGAPAHRSAFERVFGTPHHADLGLLARSLGAAYQQIQAPSELEGVLAEPPFGIEVVEAVIDRAHRRTLQAAITELGASV